MRTLDFLLLILCIFASCINADQHESTTVCPQTCPNEEKLNETTCQCQSLTTTATPLTGTDSSSTTPVLTTYECPQIKCHGSTPPCAVYKNDLQGCRTCQCLQFCNKVTCPKKCPKGKEDIIDLYGCPFCRCKNPRCKGIICRMYCPFGYEKDTSGCDICKCKPCGNDCSKLNCTYGTLVDFNECSICQCKPHPNCPPICLNNCPFGRVLDANGCPTCQCMLFNPKCMPTCSNYCEFGRVTDNNGCPTCECLTKP